MKSKFLLLALVASVGISISSFAQQRPPMQRETKRIEQRNTNAVEVRYYYIPQYDAYFDAISKVYFYKKKINIAQSG